jgi:hypothetical protein
MVTSHRAISDQLHPSKYLKAENNLPIVGDGMAGEVVQLGKTWGRRFLGLHGSGSAVLDVAKERTTTAGCFQSADGCSLPGHASHVFSLVSPSANQRRSFLPTGCPLGGRNLEGFHVSNGFAAIPLWIQLP